MKINCGLSPKSRRALKEIEAARLREWHDWFAWYPVRMGDNDCRWLETVERKWPFARVGWPLYRPKEKSPGERM